MADTTDLELRSEEVQEILTTPPSWMIRWGNLVIPNVFFLFLIVNPPRSTFSFNDEGGNNLVASACAHAFLPDPAVGRPA